MEVLICVALGGFVIIAILLNLIARFNKFKKETNDRLNKIEVRLNKIEVSLIKKEFEMGRKREINEKFKLLEEYLDIEKEHQQSKKYYVKRDHDKSYKR